MNAPLQPSRPDIEQRDLHFDLQGVDLARWHGAGGHVSQFFNALSQFFPEGEKFFIESVRHYRERIADPQLQAQVQGFIGQEAMHGREHRAYNEALKAAGYPVAHLEKRVLDELALSRRILRPAARLATTCALEHLTAIMAHEVMRDPRVLAGSDPKMAALWRWHAIEETEHKAVAFDVYCAVIGRGFRAWLLRVLILVTSTLRFYWMAASFHRVLLAADGPRREARGWRKFFGFILVTPGVLRRIVPAWLSYFRPGFHPWQHDNRSYVEAWKVKLADAGYPP